MSGKLKQKGLTRISVYANKEELARYAQAAEKLGFRRVGLPIEILKPHGFEGEKLANTDGIGPFLKSCVAYWEKEEPKRLRRKAQIREEIAALEKEDAELGG